jgi:penicillin-binding protein 2
MTEIRTYSIRIALFLALLIYAIRLFDMQILSDEMRVQAENVSIRTLTDYPARGLIYDRKGRLLVANEPVFDIEIIAKELKLKDTLAFSQLLGLPLDILRERLKTANTGLQRYKPFLLLKQITVTHYAKMQDRLSDYKGIYVSPRTIRTYPHQNLAAALGYVREIDQLMLSRDTAGYYNRGDIVGISGIEKSYETFLRGRRGTRYVLFDRLGIQRGAYKDGKYDTLPEAGKNLESSIDLELQQYGEYLMQNKIGSIVAIEPATGEILALISAPTYNPNLLTGEGIDISRNFVNLTSNPYKPLYNRALQAAYPPGSTFKLVQALIGLQEGVLDTVSTRISCTQELVKCHAHPSPLDVKGSIQHSCNPFYFKAFNRIIRQNKVEDEKEDTRIGLENWTRHVHSFGLGKTVGSDLANENAGLIPSVAYYDKIYKKRGRGWKLANIYSVSIGQGEVGLTPLQMANLAAIIANRGFYYPPHLVRKVEGKPFAGEHLTKRYTTVSAPYFEYIIRGMEDVVKAGTARRAALADVVICGKTGTVQNPHGDDHSVFIAFAPKNDPKIAIAVVVENSGFGGTWAAPIASLMIEKYLKGEVSEKSLREKEEHVLKLNVIEKQEKRRLYRLYRDSLKRLGKPIPEEMIEKKPDAIPADNDSIPPPEIEEKNPTLARKEEEHL